MKFKSPYYPLLLVIFTVLSTLFGFSQNTEFENSLDLLIKTQPQTFSGLDSILKPFERDSIKMNRFLSDAKAQQYSIGTSYALNALGVIYRNISNYDKSIALHQEANTYANKANSDEFRIVSLNMIGVAYRRMDIIKPALDFHTQALKIAYEVQNPTPTVTYNIAVSQNSIGNIYLALKQYDVALMQFTKSLEIEKKANNKLGLAINYHNIGYAEDAKGNLDNALANYEKSLFYNEAIKFRYRKNDLL